MTNEEKTIDAASSSRAALGRDRGEGDATIEPEGAAALEPLTNQATVDIVGLPSDAMPERTVDLDASSHVAQPAGEGAIAPDAVEGSAEDPDPARDLTVDVATKQAAPDQTGAWESHDHETRRVERGGSTFENEERTGVLTGAGLAEKGNKTRVGFDQTVDRPRATAKTETSKKKKAKAALPKRVGSYEILGELGRGGMGVVYKARQPGANRIVALKMVLAGSHASADQMARFHLEAEAVALLQHPNIVQLYEVGEADGCPFFSLEFVEGPTLDKKIDSTPQSPRDAALLMQKTAEAMALAHSQGIIHRDLKPANILINSAGEPKMTDFGLAKRFEDKSDGPTQSGAIMGTPSYMAPEQAQGRSRETGPAADIYSLGAILYDLLTGRPPFRGTSLLETLQQVQTMEPLPPSRIQPALPNDLQTICLKALQKEPGKRYLTMGALAEDLRRFLADEPILARPTAWYERSWKWARRKPAQASLIGVSILGVLLFLLLGGLWLDSERRSAEAREDEQRKLAAIEAENSLRATEQAEREALLRKLADKNYKRAKGAVDQMLTRVGAKTLAHIPQMEKVRRDLLNEARGFYEEFLRDRPADVQTRIEAAVAQKRLADIQEMLGQPRDAEKSYLSALEMLDALVRESPDRIDLKRDFAAGALNLGALLQDQKRLGEAEKFFGDALAQFRKLHEADPGDAVIAGEMAEAHLNLGAVYLVQNRSKEALKELTEGERLFSELAALAPKKKAFRRDLARVQLNLARLHETSDRPGALKKYQAAGLLMQGLAKEEPTNAEFRSDWARVEHQIGDLLRDNQPKTALLHYEKALELLRRLVVDFSAVPTYRQMLARSHDHVAILHLGRGAADKAKTATEEALAIRTQAVLDFPDLPETHRELAASHFNRGTQLLLAGNFKEAEEAFLEAKGRFEDLSRKHKEDPEFLRELAGTHHNLATLWLQMGRNTDAKDACLAALGLWTELSKRYPEAADYSKEVAETRLNLGALLLSLGKKDESQKHLREAVAFLKEITRDRPHLVDHRHLLAVGLSTLGNLLNDLKNPGEAETLWKESQAEYARLIELDPERVTFQQELARSYDGLAIFLAGAKRFEEARELWRKAVGLQEPLVASQPVHADYRREFAISHSNLGVLEALKGDAAAAEKQYRKALQILEEYEPKLAPNAAYLAEIIKAHYNLVALAGPDKLNSHPSWFRILDVQEKLATSFPAVPGYRAEASNTLRQLGERLFENAKYDDAEKYYHRAVAHLEKIAADPAFKEPARQSIYLIRLKLAHIVLERADHAQAVRLIGDISGPDHPPLKQEAQAASIVARAAQMVEKDKKLDDSKKKELRLQYGDLAMKLLQEAVANGFNDLTFLQGADFEALRSRKDFQELLLRQKGK